jgi:hypothetical protein
VARVDVVVMTGRHANPGVRGRLRAAAPVLVVLALLLPIGPVGLLLGGREESRRAHASTLAEVAEDAGCRLTEFRDDMDTNPPVRGRFVEQIRTRDGSYAGRRPPSLSATIHALYHGRVLFQYRPGIVHRDLRTLDRLTHEHTDGVLLFENQTGMSAPVAATAYQSVMTCSRVDRDTVRALRAFRDRRRAFDQSF